MMKLLSVDAYYEKNIKTSLLSISATYIHVQLQHYSEGTHMYVCMYVCTYVCMYIHVRMHICIYVCTLILRCSIKRDHVLRLHCLLQHYCRISSAPIG